MSGVGLMMSGYPMIKSFFGFKDLFLVVCFSLPLLTWWDSWHIMYMSLKTSVFLTWSLSSASMNKVFKFIGRTCDAYITVFDMYERAGQLYLDEFCKAVMFFEIIKIIQSLC